MIYLENCEDFSVGPNDFFGDIFFSLQKVLSSIICLYIGVKSLNTVFIRGEGSWRTWYNGCTLGGAGVGWGTGSLECQEGC